MEQVVPNAELPQDRISALRELAGAAFVDWVLHVPAESPTEAQKESAEILYSWIQQHQVNSPNLPISIVLRHLARYNPDLGLSPLNYLRMSCGGEIADREEVGDPVLDNIYKVAVRTYPEFLIKQDAFGPLSFGWYGLPEFDSLVAAVAADENLPFDSTDAEVQLYADFSTGRMSSFGVVDLASSLLSHGWRLACLESASPSLNQFQEHLQRSLSDFRSAYSRRHFRGIGLAAFSGVLFPNGFSMSLPWGRIRSALPTDYPGREDLSQTFSVSYPDGTVVTSKNQGDIVAEVSMTIRCRVTPPPEDFHNVTHLGISSAGKLEDKILQIRLAYLLSLLESKPPVLIPVWRTFVEPFVTGGSWGVTELDRYPRREPRQLSVEEATRWQEWIQQLDKVKLAKLGQAPARLLRAGAERHDATDSLIDAVIAWEALFGAKGEVTLRVSTSLAKLIEAGGVVRAALRRRVAEIYDIRSQVVHGGNVDMSKINEASKDALRIGLRAVAKLARERMDLVKMTSEERSIALILG